MTQLTFSEHSNLTSEQKELAQRIATALLAAGATFVAVPPTYDDIPDEFIDAIDDDEIDHVPVAYTFHDLDMYLSMPSLPTLEYATSGAAFDTLQSIVSPLLPANDSYLEIVAEFSDPTLGKLVCLNIAAIRDNARSSL